MAASSSDVITVNRIESKFCQIESNLLSVESHSSIHWAAIDSYASDCCDLDLWPHNLSAHLWTQIHLWL